MFTWVLQATARAARLSTPPRGDRGPFEARKFLLDGQRQPGSKAPLWPLVLLLHPQVEIHSKTEEGPCARALCGSASRGGTAWLSDFNDFLNSFCFLPRGKEER